MRSTQRLLLQRLRQIGLLSRTTLGSANCGKMIACEKRTFSDNTTGSNKGTSGLTSVEWRKKQLDTLERKFTEPSVVVDTDDNLQPMWREMEGRVTRRRPRTVEQMGGKTGRINVRKTDEEMWLREGLYDEKKPNA